MCFLFTILLPEFLTNKNKKNKVTKIWLMQIALTTETELI